MVVDADPVLPSPQATTHGGRSFTCEVGALALTGRERLAEEVHVVAGSVTPVGAEVADEGYAPGISSLEVAKDDSRGVDVVDLRAVEPVDARERGRTPTKVVVQPLALALDVWKREPIS